MFSNDNVHVRKSFHLSQNLSIKLDVIANRHVVFYERWSELSHEFPPHSLSPISFDAVISKPSRPQKRDYAVASKFFTASRDPPEVW